MSAEQIPAALQTDLVRYVGRQGGHHLATVLGPSSRLDRLHGQADGDWSWYLEKGVLTYGVATPERPRTAPKRGYGWGDWAVPLTEIRAQRNALPVQAAALDAACVTYRDTWMGGCEAFRAEHPQPDGAKGGDEWEAWSTLNMAAMDDLHRQCQPLVEVVGREALALLPLADGAPATEYTLGSTPLQTSIFDFLEAAS